MQEAKPAGIEMASATPSLLKGIYRRLYQSYGPQHWWPARTKFEVIVGAILTQNTNWQNVEKALGNLRKNKALNFEALRKISTKKLAAFIRPSGYFNIKTERLKNFIAFMDAEYSGSIRKMSAVPLKKIRRQILEVNGIGPETADSIVLYALDKPSFVVDAYTYRIFQRYGILSRKASYRDTQDMFTDHLSPNAAVYNEYHALIVRHAKEYCRARPQCDNCPLSKKVFQSSCRKLIGLQK